MNDMIRENINNLSPEDKFKNNKKYIKINFK